MRPVLSTAPALGSGPGISENQQSPVPSSNLVLYLNPSDGLQKNAANEVFLWQDIYADDLKLFTQVKPTKPLLSNGLVVFNGVNYCALLSNDIKQPSGAMHVFVAASFASAKRHMLLRKASNVASTGGLTFEWMLGARSVTAGTDMKPEFDVLANNNTDNLFTGADSIPTGQLILFEVELTALGVMTYRENGVTKGTANLISIPSGKSDSNILIIGGAGTETTDAFSRWLNGAVGTIALYSSVQSSENTNAIYQHFREVHGLTITDR